MAPSNDAAASFPDCPICLDGMREEDVEHPLSCPSKCGYNFCSNCIENLLESSKDDYQYASDGNRHVKVHLQCPQCRGDLSQTIENTLLLRKAHRAKELLDIPDSELTATQLRMKHEYAPPAKANDDDDADKKKDGSKKKAEIRIDVSLFGGLEYFMSEAEQLYVTELMVSGDANQLAQAAQILHGIAEVSRKGVTPSMQKAKQPVPPPPSRSRPGVPSAHTVAVGRALAMGYSERDLAARREMKAMEAQRKKHPLPARMPRWIILEGPFDPRDKKRAPLKFVDDEWDGSIADAFTRVHIHHSNNKTKNKKPTPPGVANILEMAQDPQISEPRQRVLVNSVRGEAGKAGVQKGDVVTHVNGEPFDGNADDLANLIARIFEREQGGPLQLVINAEEATAEVLKLRAQAIAGS